MSATVSPVQSRDIPSVRGTGTEQVSAARVHDFNAAATWVAARDITTSDTPPTTGTYTGEIACAGASWLMMHAHTFVSVTTITLGVYVYNETADIWDRLVDATGSDVEVTVTDTAAIQRIDISGYDRVAVVAALTGTSFSLSAKVT